MKQFWLNICCQDTSAYRCGEALIRRRFRDEVNGLGLVSVFLPVPGTNAFLHAGNADSISEPRLFLRSWHTNRGSVAAVADFQRKIRVAINPYFGLLTSAPLAFFLLVRVPVSLIRARLLAPDEASFANHRLATLPGRAPCKNANAHCNSQVCRQPGHSRFAAGSRRSAHAIALPPAFGPQYRCTLRTT